MFLDGVAGAGLPPVPEDPGIGLIPTSPPEAPKVEGQCRPPNTVTTSLLGALLVELVNILDKHVQCLHASMSLVQLTATMPGETM